MRDVDRMIEEALGEEERELLRSIGEEPGFMERALGMFGAGAKWLVALMMVIQTLLFIGGAWAAYQFFQAGDPVTQLRWGLPAAVLLLMALAIKLSAAQSIYSNRIICELKRIELQIARASRK